MTFLKSRGAYLKQEGELLLCAVRRFEVFRISEIIREIDPDAFIIVGDAGEIAGEGFKPMRSDDRTLREILHALKKSRGGKPEAEEKKRKKQTANDRLLLGLGSAAVFAVLLRLVLAAAVRGNSGCWPACWNSGSSPACSYCSRSGRDSDCCSSDSF